jgi:uncharacterized membrane protein
MQYAPPHQYIRQCVVNARPLILWSVMAAGALLIVGLIFSAPLAMAHDDGFLALAVYGAFSHVCHQRPERSFFVMGHQLAVCARCTGVYVGVATAALIYPLVRSLKRVDTPQRRWLFIAAVPLVIDFGLEFLGLWHNTHLSRFTTGALLGAVALFYIMPGLMELSLRGRGNFFGPIAWEERLPPPPHSSAPSDYGSPQLRI